MQAAIFGIIGVPAGYLIVFLSNKMIEKKCIKRNMENNSFNLRIASKLGILLYIITILLWACAGLFIQKPYIALIVAIIFSFAVMFSIIDLRIHIIPNEFVIFMLVVGAIFQLLYFGWQSLLIAIACMFVLMILFTVVGLILGMDKVGAGDVKLAGVMGLVLGYPNILTAVLVMCLSIIVFCALGFSTYKITMKTMLPFAPFMMIGMVAGILINLNGLITLI